MKQLAALSLLVLAASCGQEAPPAPPPAPPAPRDPQPSNPLFDPKCEAMNETAPAKFKVRFETSEGAFVVEVTRDWSPRGADRFYNLVRNRFYDECRFFRVLENFMAQVGINGEPRISRAFRDATLQDDPVQQSNTRGMVTYAKTNAPNSRGTQIFINYKDNRQLDAQGFSPFGKVIEGMEVVDRLHAGYGEGGPGRNAPDQGRIEHEGNDYLRREFPELDYIRTARIVE